MSMYKEFQLQEIPVHTDGCEGTINLAVNFERLEFDVLTFVVSNKMWNVINTNI